MVQFELLPVIFFILMTWGFGYSITRFVRCSDEIFERNIMLVGIGLGMVPFLGVLLSFFRVPLNWWLFVILSMF